MREIETVLQDFELQSADPFVPKQFVTPQGYFATLPHRHNVDGAFAARLQRTL